MDLIASQRVIPEQAASATLLCRTFSVGHLWPENIVAFSES